MDGSRRVRWVSVSGDVVIDDLVVEYSNGDYAVRPVDGFSATVADGSLALLLGPSGCGKTTLLSCLAGILRPTAGTIRHAISSAVIFSSLSGWACGLPMTRWWSTPSR